MPGYLRRGDAWWYEHLDGSWTRWDQPTVTWQAGRPPPPGPGEAPEPGWSEYRSVAFLWKALAALLAMAATVDAGAVLSDLAELELLGRIASGEGFTIAEAEANDLRQGLIGGIQVLALIATGIPFIVWLNRSYSNLRTLGVEPLRFRRWWTIGGWLIPLWSLFRPKQLVNDVWRGGAPDLPDRNAAAWREGGVPGWWIAWWLAFLLSNQLSNLAFRLALPADTIDEIRRSTTTYTAADALGVVAAILAVLVVRGVSLRQIARAERLGVERPPDEAWRPVPA
jgi:hypothetical protein